MHLFLSSYPWYISCQCLVSELEDIITCIHSSLATHGTGIDIGNLATLATSLRFVSGTGEVQVTSSSNLPQCTLGYHCSYMDAEIWNSNTHHR